MKIGYITLNLYIDPDDSEAYIIKAETDITESATVKRVLGEAFSLISDTPDDVRQESTSTTVETYHNKP